MAVPPLPTTPAIEALARRVKGAERLAEAVRAEKEAALESIDFRIQDLEAQRDDLARPFDEKLVEIRAEQDAARAELLGIMRDRGAPYKGAAFAVVACERHTVVIEDEELAVGTLLKNFGPDQLPVVLRPSAKATKLALALFEGDLAAKAPGFALSITPYVQIKEVSK